MRTHRHFGLGVAAGGQGTPEFPRASLSLALQEAALVPQPCNLQSQSPDLGLFGTWKEAGVSRGRQASPDLPLPTITHYFTVSKTRSKYTALRGKRGLLGIPCGLRGMWGQWVLCLGSVAAEQSTGARVGWPHVHKPVMFLTSYQPVESDPATIGQG